jgi:peptide/nickel transport system substrate-binding protein
VTPPASAAPTGGTLRVALAAEPTTLDPWNADAGSLVVTRQVFETLVAFEPASYRVAPSLAASWQASSDGLRWTFTLRDGVRFHDGAPLDAAAVAASFERARSARDPRRGPGAFASYRALFGGFDDASLIARVEAIDARTVRFELREGYGPFLAHLAMPPAAISRGAAGTGPFVAGPDAIAPDGTISLRRNETYRLRDAAGTALPYLDALVFRPVGDAATRLAELRAGRVDLALDLTVAQAAAARADPNLALVLRRDASLASLAIDAARAPFDRSEVRRAVAMSIDRGTVSALYFGLARPAAGVVPAGSLGYDETVTEFGPLDVAAARKLITDTGPPPSGEVELGYGAAETPTYPEPRRVAAALAADLAKIGIVARPREIDPARRGDAGAPALQLEATAVATDPDDTFSSLFGSRADGGPAWGWRHLVASGLIARARSESDPSKRAELYKQVSKIVRADVPRVPLLFVDRAGATLRKVGGYVPGPTGTESFAMVFFRP